MTTSTSYNINAESLMPSEIAKRLVGNLVALSESYGQLLHPAEADPYHIRNPARDSTLRQQRTAELELFRYIQTLEMTVLDAGS
jgi:hypothetical protein